MMRAIVRQPSPLMADSCELTHVERSPIDMDKALSQHHGYAAALKGLGAAITILPPLAGHADCAFVEDPLLVLPELVIATRPGALSRRAEGASLLTAAPQDRPLAVMDGAATLEGGDVLRVGRTLYVGHGTRTNAAGIEALRQLTAPHGYSVVAVSVPGALHLKTALTALAPDLFVANPAWLDTGQLVGTRIINVDPAEPFAANILPVGGVILSAAAHPRTSDSIRTAGFSVHSVDISEFAKAEAGLTCLSLLWDE